MPFEDCVGQAMNDANSKAHNAGYLLTALGIINFMTFICSFGICTPYLKEQEEQEMKRT